MHPLINSAVVDDDGHYTIQAKFCTNRELVSKELHDLVLRSPVIGVLTRARHLRTRCIELFNDRHPADGDDFNLVVGSFEQSVLEARQLCSRFSASPDGREMNDHHGRAFILAGHEFAAAGALLCTVKDLCRSKKPRETKTAIGRALFAAFLHAVDEAEAWLL